jgi:hypothetical protein
VLLELGELDRFFSAHEFMVSVRFRPDGLQSTRQFPLNHRRGSQLFSIGTVSDQRAGLRHVLDGAGHAWTSLYQVCTLR